MRASLFGIVALLALGLVACSESREEKYEKALRAAESAQKGVESARKEVGAELAKYEKASAAAEAAEKKLTKARSRLDSAESSAVKARAQVAKWADDATVFRTVQKRLLDEKSLREAAVSARVQGGVAYLEGSVLNESQRKRAIEIARETPGVIDVQSQITMGGAAATTPSIAPAPVPTAAPAPAPVETPPIETPPPATPSTEVSPAEPAPMDMPMHVESHEPVTSDLVPASPQSDAGIDAMPPDRQMPR